MDTSVRKASTPKDFRQRYGNMSNSTFYKLVREGKLRTVKVGDKTLVLDTDEAAWLASLIKAAA